MVISQTNRKCQKNIFHPEQEENHEDIANFFKVSKATEKVVKILSHSNVWTESKKVIEQKKTKNSTAERRGTANF